MNNECTSKAQQFLWTVQTVLLTNSVNLATHPESTHFYRACFSATGIQIVADEALRASQLIPASLSVSEAASQFCTYMLSNLCEAEEEARGRSLEVPAWFARP